MPHSNRELLLAILSVFLVLALGVFAVALKRTQQELDSMTYFLTIRTGDFHRMIQRLLDKIKTEQTGVIHPDTSTWKTYRNEKYGFEVRYPYNWTYSVEGATLSTLENITFRHFKENLEFADSFIVIRLSPPNEQLGVSKAQLITTWKYGIKNTAKSKSQSTYKISDKIEAVRISGFSTVDRDRIPTYSNYEDVLIFEALNKDIFFEIYMIGDEKSVQEIFDKFLSTFRFIPSTGSGQVR